MQVKRSGDHGDNIAARAAKRGRRHGEDR
jgi:hypothetical protein